MQKLFILLFTFAVVSASAQTIKEDFESNSLGWTEISGKTGEAIIKDGVMHIEGKNKGGSTIWGAYKAPSFIETHCYPGIDATKNFTIKCDAIAKRINDNGAFGIILDYFDNGNFVAFIVDKDKAYLQRYYNNNLIGMIENDLKIKDKKNTKLKFEIKSTYKKLEFFINDMLAIEARHIDITSNGFGFYVFGEQIVDFDNLEFMQ